MGAYLSAPNTEKRSTDGSSNACSDGSKISYGASDMQGWRMKQEDAHIHEVDFRGNSQEALFSVFDGHGGPEVSNFCMMNFPAQLTEALSNANDTDASLLDAMRKGYLKLDEMLLSDEGRAFVQNYDNGNSANRARSFMDEGNDKINNVGCTAVSCYIKDNKMYIANAGDSRIVLCRGGTAIELSTDHKPEVAEEERRIKAAGGSISEDGRVNGNLNLTRAIGDFEYKRDKKLDPADQIITANPELYSLEIVADDEFLVLGCDGIWESWTSQQIVDYLRERFLKLEGDQLMSGIVEELLDKLLSPGVSETNGIGCDNMTCIIVDLREACNTSKGAATKKDVGVVNSPGARSGPKRRLTALPDESEA